MNERTIFTSESVTEGHPDKICDRIADAYLDEAIKQDKYSRVACEVVAFTGLVTVFGEVTSNANIDIQNLVRKTLTEIGYGDNSMGFCADTCGILSSINKQSPDIALGVNKSLESKISGKSEMDIGAGDQGIMFGFACDETPELMPLPISLAHKLAQKLAEVRKNGTLDYLRPDGKTQVSVEYEGSKPVRIDMILISTQHDEKVTQEQIRSDLIKYVITPSINPGMIDEKTKIYTNPTGRFVIGGPAGDSGLSGRKIIVDTYGGYSRHGGGSFSGKDPTKVDRSAAYAARYIAKNVVAGGAASKCEVQLSYGIGIARPLSVLVDTFGTARVDEKKIEKAIFECIDLRPRAIIERFDLLRPIYKGYSSYGHMGREDLKATWENLDMSIELAKKIGL